MATNRDVGHIGSLHMQRKSAHPDLSTPNESLKRSV